jgi:ABC-type lipoprotein export system ATPase subunit
LSRTYVLVRIHLKIAPGDFASIMGPSGARKSALRHMLGTHDSGWSGEYRLDGQAVHKMGRKLRSEFSKQNFKFVFQSCHLLDALTVAENIKVPLTYRNVKKCERQAIVADRLDRFQVLGKQDLFPNQLSGRQQKLTGIARAMVASPKVILADEPAGNLHTSRGRDNHRAGYAFRRKCGPRQPGD